jgi:hypothetical protein
MTDPAAVVRRYEQWLEPGGVFVVSQYRATDNVRTRVIWRALRRRYRTLAHADVRTTPHLAWTIEVLNPSPSPAA